MLGAIDDLLGLLSRNCCTFLCQFNLLQAIGLEDKNFCIIVCKGIKDNFFLMVIRCCKLSKVAKKKVIIPAGNCYS